MTVADSNLEARTGPIPRTQAKAGSMPGISTGPLHPYGPEAQSAGSGGEMGNREF